MKKYLLTDLTKEIALFISMKLISILKQLFKIT